MTLTRLIIYLAHQTLIGILLAGVTSSTLFTTWLIPVRSAHAAANMCTSQPQREIVHIPFLGKNGGVKLDQAAEFLADMSDITGAYYDETRDQIVFIGKTNVAVPKFDKDDLAVAIRSVFFADANPGVKIEYVAPEDEGVWETSLDMNVNYMPSKEGDKGPATNGKFWKDGDDTKTDEAQKQPVTPYGIEDTAFAKVLFDADLKLKQYFLGFEQGREHPDGPRRVTSNVPGYKSHHQRYIDMNPDFAQRGAIRIWLRPQRILVDRDQASDSFVFKEVAMEVTYRDVSNINQDNKWIEAAKGFAQHHTQNFEAFAAETPAYGQVKRLAQIVGVIKWLKDNNIASDFQWARHYEPAYVKTDRGIKMIRVELDKDGSLVEPNTNHNEHPDHLRLGGGINYLKDLTYQTDASPESAALKQSALGSQPTPADFHWDFTNNGQPFEAVAVSAELFRDAGSYGTLATDLALPTVGDIPLAVSRSYSTQTSERTYTSETSLGKGWDALPARLSDISQGNDVPVCVASNIPYRLAFQTQTGNYETFTYSCASSRYEPDHPAYTSQIAAQPDGRFLVTQKNHIIYDFDFFTQYGEAFRLRKISDANGNNIHYDYNEPSANLIKISDDYGQFLVLAYGPFQRVAQVSDNTGRTVRYTYDNSGGLTRVTDESGRVTQYQYDSQNRLTSIVNPAGQEILKNQYNEFNKLTAQTDPLGRTINTTYDETNRTIMAEDSTGATSKHIYDSEGRLIEEVDAAGKSIKYTYGTLTVPETVTDKRGSVTRYQYDARGNVTKTTAPDGTTIDAAYNSADLPSSVTDNRYSPGRITTLAYDAKQNPTKQDVAGIVSESTYDQFGNLTQAKGPLGQTVAYQYNNLGLPTAAADALGNQTSYEYDSRGFLTKQTDPAGAVTTLTYDAVGNVLTATDAAGTTKYAYDILDRLTKVTLPNSTNALYTYNAANQIAKVTDAKGNATTYTYDLRGNLLSRKTAAGSEYKTEFDALSRPIKQITPLGKTSQATYDEAGNPVSSTDAKGQVAAQTFDNMSRPTQSTFADQTGIARTYDTRGNVLTATDPAGQLSFAYDQFDRLTQNKDPFGNAVNYTYDASGRRTSLTYPSGQKVNYAYNANDQLTSITDWNNQATQLSYHANGLLKEKKLGSGITEKYDYDNANRLSRLTYFNSSSQVLGQTDIERSPVGNITRLIESGPFFDQAIGAPNPTPTPTPGPSATPTPSPSPTPPPPPPPSDDLAFILQTDEAWGIDVGSNAAPAMADLDSDGKLDLLVGEYSGNINHYEQTGTKPTDAFALVTSDFFNIDAGNYSTPELADIDGDGDLDLFIGGYYGRILFYPNTGTAQQPAFSSTGTLYNSIDVGDRSVPRFVDIDADGDLDLFIGKSDGQISFYKNNGTAQATNYSLQTTNYSGIDIGSYSAPFLADFDSDQDLDLIIGTSDGKIKYYQNTGTAQAATFTLISTIASNIDVGSNSVPVARDLSGDGKLDLLIGDSSGNLELWVASSGSITVVPDTMFFGLIPIAHAQTAGQLVLYDDFNVGSSPDIAKWNTSGSATIDSGRLKLNAIGQTSTADTNTKSPGGGIPNGFNITGMEFWYQYGGGGPEGTDRRWGITNGTDYIRLKSEHTTGIARWETGGVFSGGGIGEVSGGTVKILTEADVVNVYFNDTLRFTAKTTGGMPTGMYFFASAPQIDGSENFLLVDNVKFAVSGTGGEEPPPPPPPTGSLVTTFTYDSLGQLTKAVYPDSQAFDYAYDAIGNRVGNTYDADAKLLQTGNTTYAYDNNGAILTKQDPAKTTGYAFNARHELTRVGEGEASLETWELAYARQTDQAWGFDVGSNAAPTIADLDSDGKLDLLVGENSGNINHYEQSSASPDASFTLVIDKIAGIDIGNYSAPELADIDADNDLDLFVGTNAGVIFFYRNTGSAQQPAFTLESNKFLNVDVGDYAIPRFTDIDADGDLDLFIGAKDGTIKSYKNSGTKQSANLVLDSNKYADIDVGDYAAPLFVNIDSDQDLDLLVGKSDGKIFFYRNDGTSQAANYSLQTTTYQSIDVGSRSTPFFQDLTGDGLADLLIGDSTGKLELYTASKKVTTPPDPSPKFTYDALGNRIKKVAASVETRYVNDISEGLPYVLAELNSSNQPQSLNLYAAGLTSMGPAAAASRFYPLTDPLGNVRFLTDATGTLVARYAYDPYGNIRKKEGNVNSAFTFSGEQFDPETSLTFLRARYYDPSTGTFLAQDPVLGPLDTPLEHGEYLYARNNPVNLSDPSGKLVELVARMLDWGFKNPGTHYYIDINRGTDNHLTLSANPQKLSKYVPIPMLTKTPLDYELGRSSLDRPDSRYAIASPFGENTDSMFIEALMAVYGNYQNNVLYTLAPATSRQYNSNSFAWSLLTGAGVSGECLKSLSDPGGADWAPGWGNYVPGMSY